MISGIVIHGDGMGKTFGFPTANLDCSKKQVKLSAGVYAAWTYYNKKKYSSALVIQEKPWKVEVYLIDFKGDLYGKYLDVDLVQKVGEIERVDTREKMIKKIGEDAEMVKKILEN